MKKRTIGILVVMILLLLGVVAAYTAIGMYYQTHFFEHVTINGIDVSDLTAEAAELLIAEQAEDYRVTLATREGTQEVIEGDNIGYHFVSGGEVQEFLEQQNVLAWLPAYLGDGSQYTMEASVAYDETKLAAAVKALNCMQEDQTTAPQDAQLSRQDDGTYVIVPEKEGNQLDPDKVITLVNEAIKAGDDTVDLEAGDCYLKPAVYSTDGALRAEAAVRNRYGSMTITYQMGGGVTETLDRETISSWFSLDEDNQPVFDREAVAAWVNQLADQYDTIGTFPAFVTSNGDTVYPEARTYGWQMDRETETEELYQLLMAGDSAERSPVWFESARTRGQNDIGDTYVEIDYTNQRMWFYKDGALLVETSVVTGNVSAGNASPEGIFCLVGKEENATLVGEDYKTPVDYWMPFYGGVGIHDADSWRSAYGGDIYLTSGSHGCINTPTAQAAIIYENIEVGTPIVCYSSGVSYGYGQTSGGGAVSNNGSSDIVIIDGGGTADTDAGDVSAWTDETSDQSGTTDAGVQTGEADFPIVIEDSWSEDQVIY